MKNGDSPAKILAELYRRSPELSECGKSFEKLFELLSECFSAGGKLLCCGNGGSAADCEHITGELMKDFLKRRPLPLELSETLMGYGEDGSVLARSLQGALPCLPVTGCPALSSAFANDIDPRLVYAQQVYGFGKQGDVLLAISTSGNSRNCLYAAVAAKACGIHTVAFTGCSGGRLAELCDIAVCAPADETYRVQEYQQLLYHALCAMLEARFFSEPLSTEGCE